MTTENTETAVTEENEETPKNEDIQTEGINTETAVTEENEETPKNEDDEKSEESWKSHAKKWEKRATKSYSELKAIKEELALFKLAQTKQEIVNKYNLPAEVKGLLEGSDEKAIEEKAKILSDLLKTQKPSQDDKKTNILVPSEQKENRGGTIDSALKSFGL